MDKILIIGICDNELLRFLFRSKKYFEIESNYNCKILFGIDHTYIVNNNLLLIHIENKNKYIHGSITMLETWLKKYEFTSDNINTLYSFGSLFGKDAVILNDNFKNFQNSEIFKQMINKKLKNVIFILDEKNKQYILQSFEYRE